VGRTRTLSDLGAGEVRGKRLFVRVDFNVPLNESGEVTDTTRIDATLPTIRRLQEEGGRILLVSHLGRPDGERDPSASLAPVAKLLSERLGSEVPLIDLPPGSAELASAVEALRPGEVALYENIRFLAGETKNDPELSHALGELGDGFVSDAFGVAHRAHASNVGVAEVIREKGGFVVAGFLVGKEVHFLREVVRTPERPFLAVMGGAKISGKIDLIRAILPKVDRILIGGAMANTFFRALGLSTGKSLVEEDRVEMAAALMEEAGEKLVLPVDCVVAEEFIDGASIREVDRTAVGAEDRIGDIGPRSRELFAGEIGAARTLLWNGPMGIFERADFAAGTLALAHSLAAAADAGNTVVVGGGDSVAAAAAAGVTERMSHISTGGGASLDLLAGAELPGISILDTVADA
jgi:phosphoglycerate kinase